MSILASFLGRPLKTLSAVAFLAASGAGPAGLHPCPHHGGEATSTHGTAAPSGGSAHAVFDVHEAPSSGSHPAGPEHPCTCVGACHGSAASPVPPSAPGVESGPGPARDASGTLVGDAGLRGPRHLLFELHLPNAPPRSS